MSVIYIEVDSEFKEIKQVDVRGFITGGLAGAAVGSMLGAFIGDPTEALISAVMGGLLGAALGRQKKVKFPTGKQVDIYLNAEPILSKHIQDKVSRGFKIEGNIRFLEREEFVDVCFEYFAARMSAMTKLPQLKNPLKASNFEDKVQELASRTNGFLYQGLIYINQDKAEEGTVIHESLHFFQDISYYKLDININEGTTEYFTRLICKSNRITRRQKYQKQHECIEKLVEVCGRDKLAGAYFQGNISALQLAVDGTKGQGTFSQWVSLMNEDQLETANKLL